MSKVRLDLLLTQLGLVNSRSKAQSLIMAGRVQVDGQVVTKAGHPTAADAKVCVEEELPYVSRGGIKLAAALDAFGWEPVGAVCADVGASTGGFTDVLLQRGAAHVYAIDVGYGQLAWKLRQDKRVTVMERTNARYLESLPHPIDLVTIDASFISLKLILPAVKKWLAAPARVIALIKPQFEAGKSQVGKGGVVRNSKTHREVLEKMIAMAGQQEFDVLGLTASPITGPAGNHEFLLYLGWRSGLPIPSSTALIQQALLKIYPDAGYNVA
ncbi:MAG: 16S/23S rRNA (cytidine-2'-O)-methyltransferase TlyA [Anaerolineae bacterium]|nr:16S/23S rRNA (cytidine-2'-O)-methyltransferase TlyA [Anaerolineae bacterium]